MMQFDIIKGRTNKNVLFNDALNTLFYLWLYGISYNR